MTEAAKIAAGIRERYDQVTIIHLGDELPRVEGKWYFRFPNKPGEVLMEPLSGGGYPYLIRNSEDDPDLACPVQTFDEAVTVLGKFLDEIMLVSASPVIDA